METKRNIIDEFETKGDSDYSYQRIARTKDEKIIFYSAKLIYDRHKKGLVNNKVYIVAQCSQENMKNIINSKLDEKQHYVEGENVYLIYNENDFDKIEADNMKKYVKFPLYLDYNRITQQIFDNNIDKDIENRINSILKENKETKKECINTNNNNKNIQIDNKNIFNTYENNKTLKKNIHNNNFKEESKEEEKPENNNKIKSNNNNLKNNINENLKNSLNDEEKEESSISQNQEDSFNDEEKEESNISQSQENSLNDEEKEESSTSHNDDLKNKTVQQQPYYQQVWNKIFGGCCPCGLDSVTEDAEQAIT